MLTHSIPALLGSIYLNAQTRVFAFQERLKHPLGNKTHILRDISFNLWQTEPSLDIPVCLEGERAYPTIVGHGSECVKIARSYTSTLPHIYIAWFLIKHQGQLYFYLSTVNSLIKLNTTVTSRLLAGTA
jgi:hypothetical protein